MAFFFVIGGGVVSAVEGGSNTKYFLGESGLFRDANSRYNTVVHQSCAKCAISETLTVAYDLSLRFLDAVNLFYFF